MQDPNLILEENGADPLRLYLINSPVVQGGSLRFRWNSMPAQFHSLDPTFTQCTLYSRC